MDSDAIAEFNARLLAQQPSKKAHDEAEEYYRLRDWADTLNERDKQNQYITKRNEAYGHDVTRFKRIGASIAEEKKRFPVKRFRELAEKMKNGF